MKYVIFDQMGQERVVVFDEEISHACVVHPENGEPVAAGFFYVDFDGSVVLDKRPAQSLADLGPRPQDASSISLLLKGFSSLE